MAEVDEVVDFDPQAGAHRSNSRTRSLSASRRPSKADGQVLGLRTVTPPLQNVGLNVGQFPTGSRIAGRRPSQPKLSNGQALNRELQQGLQGSQMSGDLKRDRQPSSERMSLEASRTRGSTSSDVAQAGHTRSLSVSGRCAQRKESPKADSRRRPSRAGLNSLQAQLQAEPSLRSLQDTLNKLEEDKERSQGHAAQVKRALDKLGILGALKMQPSTGRSRDACDHALTTAVGNAVGGPKGKTGSQGQVHELAIMGAASPASPKGTGNLAAGTASPKRAGAGTTGSPRGQEPASGMEPETHGPALGLTIHRMETTKALEDASPRTADRDDALGEQPLPPAPADEPEGTPERQGEEGMEEGPADGANDEFDVDEEELLSEDHLRSIRRLMFILRLWSGNKASKSGSGDELEAPFVTSHDAGAEDGETPVQQVFEVVARVKARSGAMLCSQRSFENLLEILQKVDKAGGAKSYSKIPLSKVREAFNEQIALQISLSSRYGLSAAEASKGMVYETFRTCMHRLFYRPLQSEDQVKHLLLHAKNTF